MTLPRGVQRAPSNVARRPVASLLIAGVLATAALLAPSSPIRTPAVSANGPAPKAVFIVGPTNGLTDSNLADAAKMADQAQAAGMDVSRVFFPHATWGNVLANIQGANLVVYMGHGYGWPSPYTSRMTESRQNGFGLNSYDGSGRAAYTYYGATPIRNNIVLASNAVVILVHGCYTAGNGEPGMAIPSEELATARVDNYANGFLAAGARAVFAFGWNQRLNFPQALATSSATMDELFMTKGSGTPAGFIGWRDQRHASARTPGATVHLDPHPSSGYYRSVTGDLGMTATDWRNGPVQPTAGEPPQITELSAAMDVFHPNGDGLDDDLVLRHNVTRASYLDVTVYDSSGEAVRSFRVSSSAGSGTSRWDGRGDAGSVVADGQYTLTYVPRDISGLAGDPASVNVAVLTAIAVFPPTRSSIHVSDGDGLARSTSFKVTMNQPARLTWRVVDESGDLVRSIREAEQVASGTQSFVWDGRDSSGEWVADGVYRSIVSAQTGLGAYSQEVAVFVGAFRISASSLAPARGDRVTLNVVSTERLATDLRVTVNQTGVQPWRVTATHVSGRRYRVSVSLRTGGTAGSVQFVASGTDTGGGRQSSALTLPLQ